MEQKPDGIMDPRKDFQNERTTDRHSYVYLGTVRKECKGGLHGPVKFNTLSSKTGVPYPIVSRCPLLVPSVNDVHKPTKIIWINIRYSSRSNYYIS